MQSGEQLGFSLGYHMNHFKPYWRHVTLRSSSWVIFVSALTVPTIWGWYQLAEFHREHPEPGCGMPIIGIYAVAVIVSAVLSLLSAGLGLAAFFGLPRPRALIRKLEVAVLLIPAMVGVALIISALLI